MFMFMPILGIFYCLEIDMNFLELTWRFKVFVVWQLI